MNQPDKQIYYRLTALWIICEALMGGIIHGLKLPISGLIVGSSAVLCICMMAYYYPLNGAIIKSTIIVAIFKFMLSPQSPFPAYIAVIFQGAIGELIFRNRKYFKFNCLLFAATALIESAIQRLLVMTLIFGMDLWKAFDTFISGITGEKTVTTYSYYLAVIYVLIHITAGLIVGWYAGKIPEKIKYFKDEFLIQKENITSELIIQNRKKSNRIILIILLIFVSILFIQSVLNPENAFIPNIIVIRLLIRSTLIILIWITIINPLLTKLLHNWLENKKTESQNDIKEIMKLLPVTQFIFRESWRLSSSLKGIRRLSLFFTIVFLNSLNDRGE